MDFGYTPARWVSAVRQLIARKSLGLFLLYLLYSPIDGQVGVGLLK
jgi:hypothetical protein